MTVTSNIHVGMAAWGSNQTVTVGARRSSGGQAWQASSAGTTGATAPSGTGPVSDGAVNWTWLSAVDFTSIAGWNTAWPGTFTDNLVGRIWNNGPITPAVGVAVLDTSGHTMGGFTATLTAAPGEGISDALAANPSVPLYPDQTKGVAIVLPSGVGGINYLNIADANVILDGLQFIDPNSTSGSTILNFSGGATGCIIRKCIISGYSQSGGAYIISDSAGILFENSILIDNMAAGATTTAFRNYVGTTNFVCALLFSPNSNTAGQGFFGNASVNLSAFFGFSTPLNGSTTGGIPVKNSVLSIASGNAAIIDQGGNTYSASRAAQYQSTTNLRLIAGSNCIHAGPADTADIPTGDDIAGRPRNLTLWDAGPYAYGVSFGRSVQLASTPTARLMRVIPERVATIVQQATTVRKQRPALLRGNAATVAGKAARTGKPASTIAAQVSIALGVVSRILRAGGTTQSSLVRQTGVPAAAAPAAPAARLARAGGKAIADTTAPVASTTRGMSTIRPVLTSLAASVSHPLGKALPTTASSQNQLVRIVAAVRATSTSPQTIAGIMSQAVRNATLLAEATGTASALRQLLVSFAALQAPAAALARSAATKQIATVVVAATAIPGRGLNAAMQLVSAPIVALVLRTNKPAPTVGNAQVSVTRRPAWVRIIAIVSAATQGRQIGSGQQATGAGAATLQPSRMGNTVLSVTSAATARLVLGTTHRIAAVGLTSTSLMRGWPMRMAAGASGTVTVLYNAARTLLGSVQGQAGMIAATRRTIATVTALSTSATKTTTQTGRATTTDPQASAGRRSGKIVSSQTSPVAIALRALGRAASAIASAVATNTQRAAGKAPVALLASAAASASLSRSAGKIAVATSPVRASLTRLVGAIASAVGTSPLASVVNYLVSRALLRQDVLLPAAVRLVVLPPEGDPTMSDLVSDPPEFSAMDPADGDVLSFDWSRRTEAGDQIVSASVTSVPSGIVFDGAPLIAGTIIQVKVSGIPTTPPPAQIYGIRCTATFASGRRRTWTVALPIQQL